MDESLGEGNCNVERQEDNDGTQPAKDPIAQEREKDCSQETQSEINNSSAADVERASPSNGATTSNDDLDMLLSKQKHITKEEMEHWKKDFDEFVGEYYKTLASNSSVLVNEEYDRILEVLPEIDSRLKSADFDKREHGRMKTHFLKTGNKTNYTLSVNGFKSAEKEYQQLLRWKKNYEIPTTGGLVRAGYESLDKAFNYPVQECFSVIFGSAILK